MIAADTSALIEVALDAQMAELCRVAMAEAPQVLISAGTLHEALVVGRTRRIDVAIEEILTESNVEIVALDAEGARRAANAYARFGKGIHPAGLNLADCFSYALADQHACPLLFVGNDFAHTDIESALA